MTYSFNQECLYIRLAEDNTLDLFIKEAMNFRELKYIDKEVIDKIRNLLTRGIRLWLTDPTNAMNG